MEEEIKTKNLSKEEMVFWKDQTKRLLSGDNSIKGALKECGTLFSDDILTYSLTNTFKTIESFDDPTSNYDKNSSKAGHYKMDGGKKVVDTNRSMDSSKVFSSLKTESYNGKLSFNII